MAPFKDNQSAWITAIGTIIGAIAGAGGTYFFGVWSKPDLRYEEMPYYRVGAVSVVSLKLENFGGSDAEKIMIRASFPKPLSAAPESSNESLPFVAASGFVKGNEAVAGTIERVTPDQSVYVYYTVEGSAHSGPEQKLPFVTEITFKGGKAKMGRPFSLWPTVISLVIGSFCGLALIPVMKIFLRRTLEREHKKFLGMATDVVEEHKKDMAKLTAEAQRSLQEATDKGDALIDKVGKEVEILKATRDEARQLVDRAKEATDRAVAAKQEADEALAALESAKAKKKPGTPRD